MKLSPMSSIIAGKSLLVIDDSIVRGTTSKRIVENAKRSRGKRGRILGLQVLRIKFPCFLWY